MNKNCSLLAASMIALVVASSAASASASRTFVSGVGNDTGACPVSAPCRTFAYALTQTAPSGEIIVLSSAGYGTVTITQAVSIINTSNFAGVTVASGNGITINANTNDSVTLRGLTVDGGGTGSNGIVFNSGGSLTVTNCVAQNFVYSGSFPSGVGVLIQPTSGAVDFSITNTIVTNDGGAGIAYHVASGSPIAHGVIDHVAAVANPVGISIEPSLTSPTAISISNSVASNNSNDGIFVDGPATVSIDNTNISGNINVGISAAGTPKVLLGRSVVTGNGTGIQNNTSPNTFYTYKDNRINENTTDITSPLNTTLALQ